MYLKNAEITVILEIAVFYNNLGRLFYIPAKYGKFISNLKRIENSVKQLRWSFLRLLLTALSLQLFSRKVPSLMFHRDLSTPETFLNI